MSSDYDYEPKSKPSKYLRLKDKDQSFKVRIATAPYRIVKVFRIDAKLPMDDAEVAQFDDEDWFKVMGDPDFNVVESYVWGVIDRSDGNPRYVQASKMVYKAIKDYGLDPDWGDPTGYDITITRTEKPGSYYTVKASPNKTDLTDSELQKVKDNLDFKKDMPNARSLKEKQPDDIDDYIETLQKKDISVTENDEDDVEVETHEGDPNDIPFND